MTTFSNYVSMYKLHSVGLQAALQGYSKKFLFHYAFNQRP